MRTTRWQRWSGLLFVTPWLITFLWFTLGPFIASIFLSFTNYRFIGLPEWVGLNNYVRLFTDDAKFIRSVINTLYYTAVHVPGIMIMAFFVAILLNQKVKGQPIYRTAFYLPSVTAGVATAYLWILLLQPNGLVNQFLGLVGIDGPNWLTSSTWAMPALILMSFWGLGTTMIIYLAALQGIPQHLYEAASVDGAGVIRKMWHVTVPMMTPAIFLTAVLQIIGSWQVFTQALIVTNGGPRDSTLFILLHLYRTGFEYFQMGYASAIAWVLFVIILVFTILQFGVARRWVYYEGSTER
ncbi:MAG: sugar ABC transporter permease [Chloroflexota bacterium]|nr:sugar ABC transporter permease [Chloroflexota bacterium]MDE2897015.1 sugar ABC transporter permease [Chloroflexota bacterium]